MKIAANLSLLFTDRPLIERVIAARVSGFDGVEVQFPYELPAIRMKEVLEAAGLPLILFNLPAGDLMEGGPGLAAVPERQDQFDDALEQALSYAAMTRPRFVNVLAGRQAEGVSRDRALACLAANLRKTAEAFAVLHIGVVCEAINPLDMPGFLINTPEQLDVLLRDVDHPNLQAQYDLYHMARQGVDAAAGIRLLAGRIGHVQFADCPGRGEPGTGNTDFGPALRALQEDDYPGWLGAEYKPTGVTAETLGWLPEWKARLA
ncbi:TIM barrel protein [Pseudomonas sp. JM0905a]|uniref:hydroxypyruvate isomerase family protein n=1 Tax=Pseudomonas sp. JM0905a TaxID=2772484 RepID=UPI001687A7E9|nr:TIM barrel protein [Pseudomonas sp. JM0905a]MBD2839276.1 TIM barrel protein [Pseudomonas sp. JM0905a]